MIDLTVRDLTKTEDEDGAIDFIALTNPQWEMIKVNIDLLKNHEKCELMYVEDFLKILAKERADAIDEFYNALTSKRCECCNAFRNECDKCGKCFIDEIAEQLKENSNV